MKPTSRRSFIKLLGTASLPLAAGTAAARGRGRLFEREPRVFVAGLNGRPHGIDTRARGLAFFRLNHQETKLRYLVAVANIQDVLMAHIHLESVSGPITVWLHDHETQSPEQIDGRFSGVLAHDTITDEDVIGPIDTLEELAEELRSNNGFVNVHTQENPAGEIGGQIHPRG